jgi:hypothetical protein
MIFGHKGALLSLAILVTAFGCGPNKRIIESGRENPPLDRANANLERPVRSFETDLKAMRTADFYFIYVFRRRDGGTIHADDKRFLAANLADVNRRELSDEGRALITGSNFLLPENMMLDLKERFVFEDHSKPVGEIPPERLQRKTPGEQVKPGSNAKSNR